MFIIDFGLRSESEAKQFSEPYQLVRDRVKPERDANADRGTRERWWLFGRNRDDFRPALASIIHRAQPSRCNRGDREESSVALDESGISSKAISGGDERTFLLYWTRDRIPF
jgi:hypothetical protein